MAHYDCSCCGETLGISCESCGDCKSRGCTRDLKTELTATVWTDRPRRMFSIDRLKTLVTNLSMLEQDSDSVIYSIPDEVIEAGMKVMDKVDADLTNYVSGVTPDWDDGMIVSAVFKAMLTELAKQTPRQTR